LEGIIFQNFTHENIFAPPPQKKEGNDGREALDEIKPTLFI
jgi:hypothetical protein